MKTINVFFLCLLIIFMSGATLQSAPNISCPSGYTHYVRTVSVTVGGTTCNYIIDICVLCENVTHIDSLTIMLKAFRTLDTCNQDPNLVNAAIYSIITDPFWINFNIPISCFTGIIPCEEGYFYLKGVEPVCWKKVGYLDDYNNLKIAYVGCYYETCECVTVYRICWDGSSYTIDIESGPSSGTCNCLENEPPDPQNPDEETDCFYLEGPCYP